MAKFKVLVKVKTASGEYTKYKRIDQEKTGDRVQMQTERGKRPEWHFNLGKSSLYWSRRFGKWRLTIDVFQFSQKAIQYDWVGQKIEQPLYDRVTEQELVNKAILDKAGEKPKETSPGLIFLVLLFSLITMLLVGYMMLKQGII